MVHSLRELKLQGDYTLSPEEFEQKYCKKGKLKKFRDRKFAKFYHIFRINRSKRSEYFIFRSKVKILF